jgi:hypothetical protein
MHPTKFRFIWPSGFRGEDFLEINQSETIIVCHDDEMVNVQLIYIDLCGGP